MNSRKKVDHNHASIVSGLRRVGASVASIASVGGGVPDILVAYRGTWYVAEIKDGEKSASRRKLTIAEKEWHALFSQQAPVHIWASLEDAFVTLGIKSV